MFRIQTCSIAGHGFLEDMKPAASHSVALGNDEVQMIRKGAWPSFGRPVWNRKAEIRVDIGDKHKFTQALTLSGPSTKTEFRSCFQDTNTHELQASEGYVPAIVATR